MLQIFFAVSLISYVKTIWYGLYKIYNHMVLQVDVCKENKNKDFYQNLKTFLDFTAKIGYFTVKAKFT